MKKLWGLIIMGTLLFSACDKSEMDVDQLGTQVAAEIFSSQTAVAMTIPTQISTPTPKYAVISPENVKDLKELGNWISYPILDLAYAPAGGRILAQTSAGIQFFRDEDLEFIDSWEMDEPLWTLALSPDGEILAGSGESGISLWRIADGRLIRTINTSGWADPLNFSPDGTLLAADTSEGIQIWLVSDGSLIQTIETFGEVFAFHPNGRIFTAYAMINSDNLSFYTTEWDPYTGQEMGGWGVEILVTETMDGEDQFLYDFGMTFSSDGNSVAFWWEGTLAVVQIQGFTARLLSRLDDERIDSYSSVFFSLDGESLFLDANQIQQLQIKDLTSIRTFTGAYPSMSPDGQNLVLLREQGIEQWRLSDGTFIRSAPYSSIVDYSLSGNGDLLAVAKSDGVVELWEIGSAEPLYLFQGPQSGSNRVLLSSNGNFLAIGMYPGPWDVYSVQDGTLLYRLEDISQLHFTEEGNRILNWTQGSPAILLQQAVDSAVIYTMQHPVEVNHLVATEDGATIAAAIADGTIWLWRSTDGVLLRTIDDESIPVKFSSNGQYLLTQVQDDTFKLWLVETGELLGTYSPEEGEDFWEYHLCGDMFVLEYGGYLAYWRIGEDVPTILDEIMWAECSIDGSFLATTSWEEGVEVWQMDGRAHILSLSEAYRPIGFSLDNKILITIDRGTNLQFWSVNNGNLLRTIEILAGWIGEVRFAAGGRVLLVNAAQSLFLWGLPIQ